MSNDDSIIIPKQGWIKIKLHSQIKWHRRYCIIDWDKAILFITSKSDKHYRNWIKLLPNIFINDCELTNDNTIEIKVDNEIHLLQTESKKEHDSWLLILKRTAYSRIGGGIFGQSLEDTYKYSRDKTSFVPLIVRHCCEYLLEYGSTFVGLFRIPGKQSSIKELRDMYDRGIDIQLNNSYSPATISSLLKIYLQSLPESIIPIKNFDEFLEIGSCFKYNQTNDINRLKKLIETTLSNINYALLAYLCVFLKKLTEYVNETKMDTDNLAVTFGHNLIRPSEELDLNMIKGHNYNLLPLIKALIDNSEYLFSMNTNDICEQNNESITKSSGFSSFSSLLSSNEQPIRINSRSSSMPSIPYATFLSMNNSNLSYNNQLNSQQSFITCFEREFSINQENNEEKIQQQSIVLEEKHKSDILFEIKSKSNVSSPIYKIQKKTFVNKFGKSFSSFKSSMSKAFHPHFTSTENIQQSNPNNILSSRINNQYNENKIFDSNLLTNCLKTLQNEIQILKELINEKENLLINLTKTSYEERLKYEKENNQLKQKIEQLQKENYQLKAHNHSDN